MRIKFSERLLVGEENSREIVVVDLSEENLSEKKIYLEFEKPNGARYLTEYLSMNEDGEIVYVLPYSLLDEMGVLKVQCVIIGKDYTKKSDVEAKFVCCSLNATEKVADEKGVLGLLSMLKNDGDGTQALFDDGTYKSVKQENLQVELMKEVTYDELVELRNNGQLVPGQQYRIIDYDCTTTQSDTASAMHPFDIIVTADSENILNENARACLSARDNNYFRQKIVEQEFGDAKFREGITYEDIKTHYLITIDISSYDVEEDTNNGGANVGRADYIVEIGYETNNEGKEVPVFWKNDAGYIESGEEGTDYGDTYYYVGQEEVDGVIYDKWRKIEGNDLNWNSEAQIYVLTNVVVETEITESEPIYIDNNLHTWEIKYSLDNDKSRFAWACDGLQIYTDDGCWLKYIGEVEVGGEKYHAWENKEELIEGILLSKTLDLKLGDTLAMLYNDSGEIEEDYSTIVTSIPNNIKYYIQKGKGVIYYMKDDKGNECGYDFKNIVYYNWDYHNPFYTFNKNNSEREGTRDLSLSVNEFIACCNNVIKPLRYDVQKLNFTIFGGEEFVSNTLDYDSSHNFFDQSCYSNTFGQSFMNNFVGAEVNYNHFGTDIQYCEFEGFIVNQQFKNGMRDKFFAEGYETEIKTEVDKILITEEFSNAINSYSMKNIPERFLYGNTYLKTATYSIVKDIGEYAFSSCPNLEKLIFDVDDEINISNNAFEKCYNLKEVLFLENYPSHLPPYCFSECSSLEYVKLPYVIDTIGNYCFSKTNIKTIELPETLTYIGERAFEKTKLEYIYIPESVTYIGKYCFENKDRSGFVDYYQRAYFFAVETEPSTFDSMWDMYSGGVKIWGATQSVKRETDTFTGIDYGNQRLYVTKYNNTSYAFKLPTFMSDDNGVLYNYIYYAPRTFFRNTDIGYLTVPNGVELGQELFWQARKISTIEIEDGVSKIPSYCFADITTLDVIIIPTSLKDFSRSSLSLEYAKQLRYNGTLSEWCMSDVNESIHYNPQQHDYSNLDVLVRDENNEYYSIKQLEEITIPNDIEILGGYNFVGFKNLKKVIIPNNIKEIGGYSFQNCTSLEDLILNNNLEVIKASAFQGCSSLTTIEFPESLTTLGSYAFNSTNLEKINTKNVQRLVNDVFSGCANLKKVIAPKVVEVTSYFTFGRCYNLEHLEFDIIESFVLPNGSIENFKTLIIKTSQVCNYRYTINDSVLTQFPNLYIYVPDELVEQYKSATNWAVVAERFKPLSEYVEEDL